MFPHASRLCDNVIGTSLRRPPITTTRLWRCLQIRNVLSQPNRLYSQGPATSPEEVHSVGRGADKLDLYLDSVARNLPSNGLVPVDTIYRQYLDEAGAVIPSVVPYEERPPTSRRADALPTALMAEGEKLEGDGIVLMVHAMFDADGSKLTKVVVCSGFVVDASMARRDQGDLIVTCAHTLLEMQRYLKRCSSEDSGSGRSLSFVLPAHGTPRTVTRLLSSMPRADAVVLETQPTTAASRRLRPLPLTPFPVYSGMPVLTHLFSSPDPPVVRHSIARTKNAPLPDLVKIDHAVPILDGHAHRCWARGMMLGYRSYTGIEVEAGIHSSLPHILTSVLPTPGSSGGPLVNAETGCVVGMTSGRRMDNRVEGERGWGCSSEMLFEMFSLPGFTPTAVRY